MGLFDLFKKREANSCNQSYANIIREYSSSERLTPEGELPFGWYVRNKEFTYRIDNEFSYFLDLWLDARKKSPRELYSALKSFVMYLDDLENLCKQKGECFELWFYQTLASPDYIEKRKEELHELTVNLDKLQQNYYKKTTLLSVLDNEIIQKLQENDGILQADFIKLFDECVHNEVSSKLYFMAKSGELERIKSGRSYILHYKK